ncbi:MAG: hypothetical protein ABUS79_03680 [Pseudomonadota bacterium]
MPAGLPPFDGGRRPWRGLPPFWPPGRLVNADPPPGPSSSPYQIAQREINITTAAAGNTVSITDVPFQPTWCLLWLGGRTEAVDAVGGGQHLRGFGFATSPTSRRFAGSQSSDAHAGSESHNCQRDDAILAIMNNVGTVVGLADLDTFLSNGLRLIIDDAFPVDVAVSIIMGNDPFASIVQISEAAVGPQTVTGAGFRPGAAIAIGIGLGTVPDQDNSSRCFIGFAAGSTTPNQAVWGGCSQFPTAGLRMKSYARAGQFIAITDRDANLAGIANVTSFDADGCSLNWTSPTAGVGRKVHILFLGGRNYYVGNFKTEIATGIDIVETGPNFYVAGGLLVSNGGPQSAINTVDADDKWSMGGFDSVANQTAHAIRDQDGAATTIVSTSIDYAALYSNLNNADGRDGRMVLTAKNADGVTYQMNDGDPAPAFVFQLLFEGAASSDVTGDATAALAPFEASATATLTFSGAAAAAAVPFATASTGVQTHTGTGSAAMTSPAADATAAETFSGTGAAALPPPAVSAAGTESFTGTAAAALPPAAAAASGTETHTGTAAAALQPFAVSATVAETFTGTGSSALPPPAAASAGEELFTGSATAASASPGAAGAATQSLIGSATAAVAPFDSLTAAEEVFSGTVFAAMATFDALAAALEVYSGAAAASLAAFASSGAAAQTHTGAGSGAAAPFAATSAVEETFAGTAAAALASFAADAVGLLTAFIAAGSAAIASFAGSGAGAETFTGSGVAALPPSGAASSGEEAFSGSANSAASPFGATAISQGEVTSSGAAEMGSFAAAGAALETLAASAEAAISQFAVLASALEVFTGTASALLQAFAALVEAAEAFDGAGAADLQAFEFLADAIELFEGAAEVAMEEFGASDVPSLHGAAAAAMARFRVAAIGIVTLVPVDPSTLHGAALARYWANQPSTVLRNFATKPWRAIHMNAGRNSPRRRPG